LTGHAPEPPADADALRLRLLVLRCQAGDDGAFVRLFEWAGVAAGLHRRTDVFWSAMPLLIVLGFLSVLIATLSTVGVFLHLRTASLTEIQLRLAALEDLLASPSNGQR